MSPGVTERNNLQVSLPDKKPGPHGGLRCRKPPGRRAGDQDTGVSEGPETPGKAQSMGGGGTLPLPGSREETRAVSWGTGPLTLTWFKTRAVRTRVEVTTTVCWGMSMHLDVTYETRPRSCCRITTERKEQAGPEPGRQS